MDRGDKSKDSDKRKRKAGHVAESREHSGVPAKQAKSRGGATANKESGGNKSGSGRGKADTKVSSQKGGEKGGAAASRSAAKRPAAAGKAAAPRKQNRSAHETEATTPPPSQNLSLGHNGQADLIVPAHDGGTIPSTHERSGIFARVGYATLYGASFGAAFPVRLVAAVFGSGAHPSASEPGENAPTTNGRSD
jgi:hypothetical protein